MARAVGVLMGRCWTTTRLCVPQYGAGAAGYVLKGSSQQQIVRASAPPDPLQALTPRELQILELLASGLSTTAVAGRLALMPKTVNNNLSTVFGTLGVADWTEAALFARGALRRVRGPGGFGG